MPTSGSTSATSRPSRSQRWAHCSVALRAASSFSPKQDELADVLEHRQRRDRAGGAERPRRAEAHRVRGHGGLDALPDRQDAVRNVGELDGTPGDPTEHLAPGPRPQPRLVNADPMDAGKLVGLDVLEGREQGRMPPRRKFRMVWIDMPLPLPGEIEARRRRRPSGRADGILGKARRRSREGQRRHSR